MRLDTSLTLLVNFIFGTLPWVTYTVFLLGISLKLYTWFSTAPYHKTGSYSKTSISAGSVGLMIGQFIYLLLFQGRFIKPNIKSFVLWLMSFSAHISLFLILFGHLRPIGVWSASWFAWVASEQFLTRDLPFYLGWVVLGGFSLLLVRRVVDRSVRSISGFDDYFLLVILIIVFLAGNMMRVSPYIHEPFALEISPGIVMQLKETPSLIWLAVHGIAAQILIMYMPFSKLFHIIASPFTVLAYSIRHGRLYGGMKT
ncbi:MAG: respiratory nitrate reductase subunit gamma [Nitrososphaerota archaeon]